jgi:hypothetical protein
VAALTGATGTAGIITMPTDVITTVTIGTAGMTTTVTTGIKEITGLKGQTVLTSQIATGAIKADGTDHHNQTETITEAIAAHQTTVVAATGIVEAVTTPVNSLKTEAARVVHIAREGSKIISPTYIIKAITHTADGFLLLLKMQLSRCLL